MEMVAIILSLVGLVAVLAYNKGKSRVERQELEEEVESNANRKAIRNMSNDELDDELRDHWG